MSKLAEYRQIEHELESLKLRQQQLAESQEVQNEMAFEAGLKELMSQFGYTNGDVLRILSPSGAQAASTGSRKPRATKVYLNPHTGEKVVTKGGNHKTLKAWKEQYGEEVSTWLQ